MEYIALLLIGIIMLKIGWRLVFGSPKKRLQQRMAAQECEIYETERKKLYRLKENKDIEGIIEYLNYSGVFPDMIQGYAANMLGELKDPSAVKALITAIEGESPIDAVNALKEIGDPSVMPLINALSNMHSASHVRKLLVNALGDLKSHLAVDSLIALLNDEDRGTRKSAEKALKTITRESFGQDHEEWQQWWEQNKGNYL